MHQICQNWKRTKGYLEIMYKIGVISDTHGMLREEVKENLKDCDVILHGGDINKQKILDELNQIAPVYVVRGNNDKEWAEYLPVDLSMVLYGIKIYMIHNRKQITADISDRNLVIFGHSHKYEEKQQDGVIWLNPGSCGPRRFTQPITMAVIEVSEKREIQIKRIEIPHQSDSRMRKTNDNNGKFPANIRSIICSVVKDVNQGKTVAEIAKKHNISEELAEQICRLYLTHPGINADGIMTKINF